MVAQATLRLDANAIGSNDAWTLAAGASKPAAVNTDDEATSYIASTTGDVRQSFDIDTTFTETMAHILSVHVKGKFRSNSGTTVSNRMNVYINATRTDGATFMANTTWTDYDSGSLARPGGGTWTEDDLRLTGANKFEFECFHPSQATLTWCTELYAEITYIPLARTIDLEREVISRRLRLNREPEMETAIVNGWEALEAELMDKIHVSHGFAPNSDGTGWGAKNWQRGFGRLKKQRISLDRPRVVSTIGDRRRYQCTYWETMKLTRNGDPDIADGMARLDSAGANREFERTSKSWIEEVRFSGSIGLVVSRNEAKEKFEMVGELIEDSATNLITQSSFVNGTTGWTKTENAGTGDFAMDSSLLLFDTDVVSGGTAQITATAATHDVDISRATASLSSSTEYTLSVDCFEVGDGFCNVLIQNDTTTNWYNGSSWVASRPTSSGIAVAYSASGTITRQVVTFTTESTASTHTVYLAGVGTTSGNTYNWGHVQIETGAFASSRIVTEASTVTRSADSLRIRNDNTLAQRVFPVDKFTVLTRFVPRWNSADHSDRKVLWELFHDSNNLIRLEYDGTNIDFVYVHGGTTETATVSSPTFTRSNNPNAGATEYDIVCRKTSSNGELDETNGTITVFLDGTKGGTEDTVSTDLTEAATSYLQIGALNDKTLQLDGYIGEIFISPVVFTDEEIAGGF